MRALFLIGGVALVIVAFIQRRRRASSGTQPSHNADAPGDDEMLGGK